MKKIVFFIILIFLFLVFSPISCKSIICCFAEDNDLENDLSNEVSQQIDDMELQEAEELFEENNSTFDNLSLKEIIVKLVDGDYIISFENIISDTISKFNDKLVSILPVLTIVIAISLLCAFVSTLQIYKNNKGIQNVIFYVFFVTIITSVSCVAFEHLKSSISLLKSIQKQVEIISPILLSLMVAIGGTKSAAIYQSSVLIFAGTILEIFIAVITPIFIIHLTCSIVGNLSNDSKLSKFQEFISSLFKIVIGFIFTVFMGFLAVQGITASTVDGVSIKTAKFAIRSYVPVLGGYLSEGFEIFRAGSVLIKNSVGVVAIILLFGTVLSNIVGLLVVMLGLKLVAALVEPIADNRISKFLTSISKSFLYLLVTIIAVSITYFIIIILMISTVNIF